MKKDLSEQIGTRIRRSREQLRHTREQFAEKVGISPQFLAEIENGKKGMSADTLYKICNQYNLSADYILFGKRATSDATDPVNAILSNLSEPYLSLTEDILKSIEKMVACKKTS